VFFVAGDPEKFGSSPAGAHQGRRGVEPDRQGPLRVLLDRRLPDVRVERGEKKIDFSHNPFSMPQGGLEALETTRTR
jgi:aspartyl-tRNA synthetase